MLSRFHENNYEFANPNGVGDNCRHCQLPIHKAAHLKRALDALEQAKTFNIRCSGTDHPDMRR